MGTEKQPVGSPAGAVESLSPAKRALLERALHERRRSTAGGAPSIPRRDSTGPAPLSYSQHRIWFLQRWEPDSPTFNAARAIRLRGELEVGALSAAFAAVIERHQSLRTVFEGEREPRQVVLSDWSLEVPLLRLSAQEPAAREGELAELLRRLSREPFDLTADLMLRATVIAVADGEHVLLVRMHHIAADAHSDSVLMAEISELYNAHLERRPARLAELPIQYADFAVWERDRLTGPAIDPLVSYWTDHLDGAPELLALPTDHARPPVQRHRGAHLELSFPRSLAEPLLGLGRESGTTFYMTMLAAFSTLLYRWSGEHDIVLGSPIANRNNLELQGLIGFFTNTIALRVRLGGNPSFREVMRRARATALGAYAHQDLPFDKVVEAVRPRRDPSYNPLFQVNFRAQATPRPALALNGLQAEPIAVDIGFSRFDLALELELSGQAVTGYFEYDRDLFEADTLDELAGDLRALLEGAAREPDTPVLAIALPHGRRRAGNRAAGRTIARRARP